MSHSNAPGECSVAIDIEESERSVERGDDAGDRCSTTESGRELGNTVQGFGRRLLEFFTGPEFCVDDYADLFLLFLGEDIGVRLPGGKIRGYQNIHTQRIKVINCCLTDMLAVIRKRRPGYTEANLGDYLDAFLSDKDGWMGKKISKKARDPPYLGYVARQRGAHVDDG